MFSKRTIITAALIFAATACLCISTMAQRSKIYEINTSANIPLNGSEAAIESYERVIHHLIDKQSDKITVQIESVSKKLDTIDQRLSRIEKALGIEPPQEDAQSSQANPPASDKVR